MRWTVQHSRDKENASLELRADGSGHLTRGNRCVSGRWRIETRTKKGEELRLLHFHARDGADGLVYMGSVDAACTLAAAQPGNGDDKCQCSDLDGDALCDVAYRQRSDGTGSGGCYGCVGRGER